MEEIHKLSEGGTWPICGEHAAKLISCWAEEVTCPKCLALLRAVPKGEKKDAK
uniref:Uncharacterized protein n=1 Tax=viral metagenome TaxID=1070528 RepID=A0A6M3IPT9_9ZZZZ